MANELFTAQCIWRGPYDNEEVIYLCGITQKVHTKLKLVNVADSSYADNTAFQLVGTLASDKDRLYKPYSTDSFILYGLPSNLQYGIDDDKNLIIFDQSFPIADVITDSGNTGTPDINITLIQNYASIYKSNLVSFEKVTDFNVLRERAISSMVSTSYGIYMGGVSGNVWFYDGNYVKGPIFKAQENGVNLPISSMISHKFDYEDEDFLYIGCGRYPRVFRSKLNTASDGALWESISGLASTSGGVQALGSAFDKLFIGTRDNKIHKYSRSKEIGLVLPTNMLTFEVTTADIETETLDTVNLVNSNLMEFESDNFGVKCFEVSNNEIFAGIDDRPELWSYSEIQLENPSNEEDWTVINFNELFMNDPSPAQYYTVDGKTISRNDPNLAISRIYNQNKPYLYDQSLVIKGNTVSSSGSTYASRLFEFSDGSDWEQMNSLVLPDQDFIEVDAASVEEVNNLTFATMDLYTITERDLILLKDQSSTNAITNGFYRYIDGEFVKELPYIQDGSQTLGIKINNGSLNKNNRYLLDVPSINDNTYAFYKPKHTLEFDLLNLSYDKSTDCSPLPECVYLNNFEIKKTSAFYQGFQGVEVGSVYGNYLIEVNQASLVLKSGHNEIVKTLPVLGNKKTWEFYSVSGTAVTSSAQSWTSVNFIENLSATTLADTDPFGTAYNKYVLRITPSQTGNPSVSNEDFSINVTNDDVIKIKAKIEPKNRYNSISYPNNEIALEGAEIKAYWAFDKGVYTNSCSASIDSSGQFIEYTLSPNWHGTIKKLKLEFSNLPDLTDRPTYIYLDSIKVASKSNLFDINNEVSSVRVNVEDRDIKLYLGNSLSPFINVKNFVSLDNYNSKYVDTNLVSSDYDKPYLKFGKLNNYADNSMFAWSKIAFAFGESLPPTTTKVVDFSVNSRLQSAGGIRLFSYHNGTLYCVTDGIISTKVSDNPDDRQAKAFKLDTDTKTWKFDQSILQRLQIDNQDGSYELYGIIRPVSVISYKGCLYLSGQYGNIKAS